MKVTPDRFADFFRAVHGDDRSPFPWQERLLRRVTGQESSPPGTPGRRVWPEVLSLPTSAGKTTSLDVALFALACQADVSPSQRTAPRRILFVVDRRVIVDEAFEHACKIRDLLQEARSGILRDIADALRKINGNESQLPLTCHQLRNGMYRDDAWARTPSQPCVICSTVDQTGSRLLFRGYGKSFKAWPIHAGLAGNDALIILDEAHCATAFLQTMRAIVRYRSAAWAKEPLGGPFDFAIMSATPPAGATDVFRFDMSVDGEDLRDCPVLRRRITSSKPTRLVVAKGAKGAKGARAFEELAEELVSHAAGLVSDQRQRVAILVNRVRTARLVHDLLAAVELGGTDNASFDKKTVDTIRKKLPKGFDVRLLTGRMRPYDRDRAFDEWLPRDAGETAERGLLTWFGTSDKRPTLPRPAFVIATQCLEVGANLDFDAMVSECASLDALRQRFGRLNRTGRDCPARGVIVVRADQAESKDPDPVYGGAIGTTWAWLKSQALTVEGGEQEIDFGIGALQPLIDSLGEEESAGLTPPAPDAPVMLPSHVDCWVQTAPVPCPDPDVAVFLHGPDVGLPDVQVCWRADLPEQAPRSDELAIATVALCPPTRMECLPVPWHVFRSWLQTDDANGELASELTDVEGQRGENSEPPRGSHASRWGVVWRGPDPDDSRLMESIDDARPGDTIVLPTACGGSASLGEVPAPQLSENADLDIAEVCHVRSRRKAVLRLCPSLMRSWLSPLPDDAENAGEVNGAIAHLQKLVHVNLNADAEPDRDELCDLLHIVLDAGCVRGSAMQTAVAALLSDQRTRKWKPKWEPHPFQGLVLRGRRLLPSDATEDSDTFTTEDDSASGTTPISLAEHSEAVGEQAARFAACCGFSEIITRSIRLAGELHDLGKADPRFQALLHGGSRVRADLSTKLFAKSDGLVEGRNNRSWHQSGLPDGFRHELLSLALAEHRSELLPTSADMDLVLHLVAMHHGRCRPFADVVIDHKPPDMNLARLAVDDPRAKVYVPANERREWIPPHHLDAGVAERFWRLVRRFGWWGLAWIEAVFVLADYRVSEAEMQRFSESPNEGDEWEAQR